MPIFYPSCTPPLQGSPVDNSVDKLWITCEQVLAGIAYMYKYGRILYDIYL